VSPRLPTILLAVLISASPLLAEQGSAIVVHLADGTNLLLRSWSFTYEYASAQKGEPPTLASTAHREARDLWAGKKAIPLTGRTLEIRYAEENQVVGGALQRVPVARGFVLVSREGKRENLKADPPHQDLLAPDAAGRLVQARALDLHGETIGGTQREFCLLSYSSLVECPVQADQRVVKIQFQP